MADVLRVGLLGCGNVGAAVVRMLHEHAEEIERRSGRRIEVARVAVRDPGRDRRVPCPRERFTAHPFDVVRDPEVDVVVELIGGIEPPRSLLLEAFAHGKPAVTANKELLATCGRELFEAAGAAGVDLLYEAAVGGGIPLIRPLREHLAGDRISRFVGIVNGTTNYVLTRMTEDGASLQEAVAEARALGYAEADPTDDVEGHDAAAKAAILATIAFDVPVSAADVYREGISGVTAEDIRAARRLGYVVKLLAIAEADGGAVSVRVHPAMIPADHPLASVRESFNAVYVEGERVGPLMLYGRGAGGDPTATSVVGDIIDLARGGGGAASHLPAFVLPEGPTRRLRPIEELEAQYYLLLEVVDRPGVLAAIARAFADHGVSIKSVWQEGRGDEAQIVLVTHRATERDLRATVEDLRGLDVVEEVRSVLRVEGAEP
ncbi:MAG TPA: homoserine dehydrogenase [Actinomycetota bacterium]|nr:homoserine dehydrogenase [Actinomycetota bacterium]